MFVINTKSLRLLKSSIELCGGFQDTQFVVNLGSDSDYFAGGAAFSAEN